MDYSQMLNRFFKKDELVSRSTSHLGSGGVHFAPYITVSRDPGSGGRPIAEMLAEQLGFEFFDEKLVEEIAKSARLRKEVLEKVDEKQRPFIQDVVHNLFNPEYVPEATYMTHLCKVLLSLAQKGNAVFLGRGSNFILPKEYGLRVRITAPYRVCVARAVEYEGVDYGEARDIIGTVMAERQGFVKQYFGKDVSSPKYYDLCLNTTYMGIEDACATIKTAFKKKMKRVG